LLFARPPQPKPTLVDVSSLVATTVDLLVSDAALSDIDIRVEGASPPVVADPELLKIVFQNLIVNGAQAMRGKGRIRVSIVASDVACEVRFVDAGPGIPPDIRQKIFTPFFTTKSRGTGLGLPTAKRLVEAHRGTIHVECPPAGGTTVTIQLPVEPAATSVRAGGPVLEQGFIEP
jgi:signal transduction histidine kinase